MEEFSNRLKEAMAYRNLRQVDIVNITHIDKGTISNYLSGKYKPKNVNAVLIADALRVNVLWLLGYDGVPMEIDRYVDYTPPTESGEYTTFEWEEGFDTEITKEKWGEFYDKIVEMPESLRVELLKYVVLMITLGDMNKSINKK